MYTGSRPGARAEGLVSSIPGFVENQASENHETAGQRFSITVSEYPVDPKLLNAYVFGLMGFFAACLYLLVIAVGLRNLMSRFSKSAAARKPIRNPEFSENPEFVEKSKLGNGTVSTGTLQRVGFGMPSDDQELFERTEAAKSSGAIDDSSSR